MSLEENKDNKQKYAERRKELMKAILERRPDLRDIVGSSDSKCRVLKKGYKGCNLCQKEFKDDSDDMLGYYEWGCCNDCVRKVKKSIEEDQTLVGTNYRQSFKKKLMELKQQILK